LRVTKIAAAPSVIAAIALLATTELQPFFSVDVEVVPIEEEAELSVSLEPPLLTATV
jgi:hypothetical protein